MYILQWAYFLYRHNQLQQLGVFNSAQKAMYKCSSAPCDPKNIKKHMNVNNAFKFSCPHSSLTDTCTTDRNGGWSGGVGGGEGTRKGLGWRGWGSVAIPMR